MDNIEQIFHCQEVMEQLEEDYKGKSVREIVELRFGAPIEKEASVDKKADFHCGVEESGFHAYNCNDCPNKCDEWYQWDKEMKKGR